MGDHHLGSKIIRVSDQDSETQLERPTDEEDEGTDTRDEGNGIAPTPGFEDESRAFEMEDEGTDTRDEGNGIAPTPGFEDESRAFEMEDEGTDTRDEEDESTVIPDEEGPNVDNEKITQVALQIASESPEESKDITFENTKAFLVATAIQVAESGGDSSAYLEITEREVAADPQGDVANMIRAYAEEGFTPDDTRRIGNKIAQGEDVKGVLENEKEKSSCLIATAAFGSELAPQVELLRNFRDNYILSTAAGSSFMNVFNTWYYSFSPYIADYEREQPWLKQITRISIYPLLGILQLAEKAYLSLPGEYGALAAGAIASSLIGVIYFWPIGMIVGKRLREAQHYRKFSFKHISVTIGIVTISVISSIVVSNDILLMITASLFVLTILTISAILLGKQVIKVLPLKI
jgi:peptide/nickel transport system substrate-binding protein